MMRLKNVSIAVLACVGAFACGTSYADTLKLVSTSGTAVNNVEVYPYNLSLNGSTTTAPMMCINYNDSVTVGESWQVTGTQLSTASSTALQEDAWLFSQVGKGTYSDADIQFAVWYVLDNAVTSNSGYDAASKSLGKMAKAAVPGLTDSFLNQYTVYAPVLSNQTGWTDGTPQSFIANDPSAVTPEPSSLLLLGTGLLGASLLLMRRSAMQQQAASL